MNALVEGSVTLASFNPISVEDITRIVATLHSGSLILNSCSVYGPPSVGDTAQLCASARGLHCLVIETCDVTSESAQRLLEYPLATLRVIDCKSQTSGHFLDFLPVTLTELDWGSSVIDCSLFLKYVDLPIETLILHQTEVIGNLDPIIEAMPNLHTLNISSTKGQFSDWEMVLQFKALSRLVVVANPSFSREVYWKLKKMGSRAEIEF